MSKAIKIDITTNNQKDLLDDIDFLNVPKQKIAKKVNKEEIVKYKPVSKDFVKVDRWVLDLVIPFLNSNCSPGVSILYLDLYRMTYGYGKNNTKLTDDNIEQRVAIPKRTIMAYKKMLIKYDLIKYKKGHRTSRGEFIVKRPDQSVYFIDYIQKTASLPTKNVGSTVSNNTIYNKDNMFIDSSYKLVEDFYINAGWKKTSITRDHLDKGIKIINRLVKDGYDEKLIKDLCEYTIKVSAERNKPIYGIGFISFLLPEYQSSLVKEAERKKRLDTEKTKMMTREKVIDEELMILNKYKSMPKHYQSKIITTANQMKEDYIKTNNIQLTKGFRSYTEKYITEEFIVEIMKKDYGEV